MTQVGAEREMDPLDLQKPNPSNAFQAKAESLGLLAVFTPSSLEAFR